LGKVFQQYSPILSKQSILLSQTFPQFIRESFSSVPQRRSDLATGDDRFEGTYDGIVVGEFDGSEDGKWEGNEVGLIEGKKEVVGRKDAILEGTGVDGVFVGRVEGKGNDGRVDGVVEGIEVDGILVGIPEGKEDGKIDGVLEGNEEGDVEGLGIGWQLQTPDIKEDRKSHWSSRNNMSLSFVPSLPAISNSLHDIDGWAGKLKIPFGFVTSFPFPQIEQ